MVSLLSFCSTTSDYQLLYLFLFYSHGNSDRVVGWYYSIGKSRGYWYLPFETSWTPATGCCSCRAARRCQLGSQSVVEASTVGDFDYVLYYVVLYCTTSSRNDRMFYGLQYFSFHFVPVVVGLQLYSQLSTRIVIKAWCIAPWWTRVFRTCPWWPMNEKWSGRRADRQLLPFWTVRLALACCEHLAKWWYLILGYQFNWPFMR